MLDGGTRRAPRGEYLRRTTERVAGGTQQPDPLTTPNIIEKCLVLESKEKWTQRGLEMEIAKAMRALGYTKGKQKRLEKDILIRPWKKSPSRPRKARTDATMRAMTMSHFRGSGLSQLQGCHNLFLRGCDEVVTYSYKGCHNVTTFLLFENKYQQKVPHVYI